LSGRVFIWVQHLLGFGHFARARVVAEALRDAGFAVTLVSGGVTPAEAVPGGVRYVQLPPARAKDELFDELVDENGRDVDQAWHDRRRDLLLDAFRAAKPDAVITETFPFGRRLLEFELMALLADVGRGGARPKVISSVRDVLQRPRKDARAQAMVARARELYDAVIVHGDPTLVRIEQSFPEIIQIKSHCIYSGYICATTPKATGERREVLVSAGGGAAGRALIGCAIAAKAHSRLQARPWTFVTGPLAEGIDTQVAGSTIVRSLPDFRDRLACAAVSVSQAGYNTLTEAVSARTPTVAVPFETDREKEQFTRAETFAARGLVTLLRARDLEPRALARTIDDAEGKTPPRVSIDVDGRAGTVRALKQVLAR
jgi:predicted glycosyltransferase